jgi:hypothetical protein
MRATTGCAAAGIAMCALVLVGCGGGGERSDVNRYFGQVTAVQRELLPQFARVNRAYQGFSVGGRVRPHELREVATAVRTIMLLQRRVDALRPPAAARAIHADLLRLLALEQTAALELRDTLAYLQAAPRALAPARPAYAALRRGFRVAHDARSQARTLAAYAFAIRAVQRRFELLRVPALLQPSFRAQLTALDRQQTSAAALAAALLRGRRAPITTQVRRFRNAGVLPSQSDAQAVAIGAYNARIREIGRTAAAISRERQRLQRKLG